MVSSNGDNGGNDLAMILAMVIMMAMMEWFGPNQTVWQ